jgi:hypothetical protein
MHMIITLFLCSMAVLAQDPSASTAVVSNGGFFNANNITIILAVLFAISEGLSFIPAIKANGVFQFIFNLLKSAVKK